MFKHYLITRFNLRTAWKTTKKGDALLNEEWLAQRFELFEGYCLPSVRNQTNNNFTWLVFFDTTTPDHFRHKIEQIALEFPLFHPIFIDGMKEFRASVRSHIASDITEPVKFVLTTRMDNDDMIHKDFIGTIQNLFKPAHKHAINLPLGYQLVTEKKKSDVYERTWDFGPFVSLIEKFDDVASVFSTYKHSDWEDAAASVTTYEGTRLWMILIHEKNKLNAWDKRFKRVYSFDKAAFGIEKQQVTVKPFLQVYIYNLTTEMLNFVRKGKQVLDTRRPATIKTVAVKDQTPAH